MARTLLLADDSITIQKVVSITFAMEDFSVVAVDNGEDALVKARELRPAVILADVVMPKRSGYELAAAIKADPDLRSIPVLLLAGTFEPFDPAKAAASQADGHIIKPFDSQALIDKVNELLGGAPAQAPQAARPAAVPAPAARPAAPQPLMPQRPGVPGMPQRPVPISAVPRPAAPPVAPPAPRPAPTPLPTVIVAPPAAPPSAAPRPAAPPMRGTPAWGTAATPPLAPVGSPTPTVIVAPQPTVIVSPPRPPAPLSPPAPRPSPSSLSATLAAAQPVPLSSPLPSSATIPTPPASPLPQSWGAAVPNRSTPAPGGFRSQPLSLSEPEPKLASAMAEAAAAASVQASPSDLVMELPADEEAGELSGAEPSIEGFESSMELDVSMTGGSASDLVSGSLADISQPQPSAREDAIDLGESIDEEPLELASPHEFMGGPPSPRPMALRPEPPRPVAIAPAPKVVPPPPRPAPAPSPVALTPAAPAAGGEAALRQALSQASREVIERVVWEVVPQLAEVMIREHIEKLARERGE